MYVPVRIENFVPGRLNYRPHAGVIPAMYDGMIWRYGFGRNRKQQILGDFGGRPESSESLLQASLREFDEESIGIFGPIEQPKTGLLLWSASKSDLIQIIGFEGNPENYRQAFFDARMDELRDQGSSKKYNPRLEVVELVWLTENQIRNNSQIYRPLRDGLVEYFPLKKFIN